ncbi:protein ELC-like [Cynara cardunculus var. scolymus]|uniref:Steadiness box n=1 Tax=Cynara cardunculus var. scolymus TaxID=59895 RepID=A0A118JT26_CYNCS|nr:protein ELC-like [Cynara cardunculus var. scolymus]XP_024992560.1 protein ELC-like [Cynara cardunculus var. scolymus]KVH89332.1 Steadiness box [Cynara cardunculus var. scolymus]
MVHPPPSSTAQYTQQFLSSVLSQRGPASLPYSEDVKWLIRQHLVSLSETYPSLQPKTATFTHNDGRSVNLLQSDGTIPMVFQNVTYNIPVVIWLMETYPRHPPLVFVNPTRDMIIKRQHAFVNPSGLVSIPYLQNWVYPSSNLVDLARNLSHYFGLDPPLYSQRRPNPTPNPSFNPSVSSMVSPSGSVSSGSIRPAIPPRSYPPSPYGATAGSGRIPSGSATEDPGEVYKRNAITKLVENVHTDVEELRKKRQTEMEGMFVAQAVLRQREEELLQGMREMQYEKEALEQQLQMVLMNTDVLEGWVRENDGKLGGNAANVNADDAFEPSDSLSKQMLDCTSSDLAIEDVIYALDKAVQEGSIPFDLYLRNVRLLSREQFFQRATTAKVRAAQMQAQVTNMASRAPPYGI